MFEQELVRTGGIKLFGSTFLGLTLITLGGILMWQLWKDRQAFQNLHLRNITRKYEEKLGHVKMRLEALTTEQSELTSQVTQLKEKLSQFQQTKTAPSVSNPPAVDAVKLAILERIVENNVKMRQS